MNTTIIGSDNVPLVLLETAVDTEVDRSAQSHAESSTSCYVQAYAEVELAVDEDCLQSTGRSTRKRFRRNTFWKKMLLRKPEQLEKHM